MLNRNLDISLAIANKKSNQVFSQKTRKWVRILRVELFVLLKGSLGVKTNFKY